MGNSFVTTVSFFAGDAEILFKHNSFAGTYQLRVNGAVVVTRGHPLDFGCEISHTLPDKRVLEVRTSPCWLKLGAFSHTFRLAGVPVAADALTYGELTVTKRTSQMGSELGVVGV